MLRTRVFLTSIIATTFVTHQAAGQLAEYRSRNPGSARWAEPDSWEILDHPDEWRVATAADGVPDAASNVTIQLGHTILLDDEREVYTIKLLRSEFDGVATLDIRSGDLFVIDAMRMQSPGDTPCCDSDIPRARILFSGDGGPPGVLHGVILGTNGRVQVTGSSGGIVRADEKWSTGRWAEIRVTGGPLTIDARFYLTGQLIVDGPYPLYVSGPGVSKYSSGRWTLSHPEGSIVWNPELTDELLATFTVNTGTLELLKDLRFIRMESQVEAGALARVIGSGEFHPLSGDWGISGSTILDTRFSGPASFHLDPEASLTFSGKVIHDLGGTKIHGPAPQFLGGHLIVDTGAKLHGFGEIVMIHPLTNRGEIRAKDGLLRIDHSDDPTYFDPFGIIGTANDDGELWVSNGFSTRDGRLDLRGGIVAAGKLGDDGTLYSPGDVLNEGITTGYGTIWAPTFVNSGVLSPGPWSEGEPSGAGVLNFEADYVQPSSGRLEIDVAGISPGSLYDQIKVQGSVDLAGELAVHASEDYVPQCCDRISMMTYEAVSGEFETYTGLELGEFIFEPVFDTNTLVLAVRDNPAVEGDACEPPGDANRDGIVDLTDILCVLDAFGSVFNQCTFEQTDLHPCGGNGVVDLEDILAVLDAFSGGG